MIKGKAIVFGVVGILALLLGTILTTHHVTKRRAAAAQKHVLTILSLPRETVQERTAADGISVVGDDEFKVQVARALTVLASNIPQYHAIVTNNIRTIHMGPYTGFGADPQACLIAKTSTVESVTWIAAILVRQALHSRIYHTLERQHPGRKVPLEAWWGWQQQKMSAEETLKVMPEMGAMEQEIEYLQKIFRKWYPERHQDAERIPPEQAW